MDTTYLLLYVDDIVIIDSCLDLLHRVISSLHQEFAMTDLGSLNYFLGISVTRDSSRMFLSQKKYAVEILERAGMVNLSELTLYRSLAGSLQYHTFTRPDISYVVQQVCLHVHDPWEPHFSALSESCVTFMVTEHHMARSGTDLKMAKPLSFKLFDFFVVYLSSNLVQHHRTKHIEIDIHFVWDLVAAGQVWVLHVPSRYQYADVFSKGLPTALFEEFRSSLSVRCPPAQTAGEC
ncbi:ribonuclease H-like domain-containing protein [Tanacetum coccineum]